MNILVTGGSKGLGKAIVAHLAADPCHLVFFTYRKSVEQAAAVSATHANTIAIHCDFNNELSVASLAEAVHAMDIDILINNAAAGFPKRHFHKTDPAVFEESFRVNVMSTVKVTQAALQHFRKKRGGRIITVLSSAVSGHPPTGWAEYVATKNYLLSLMRSWAAENIRFNISSNCVSPSFMQTDFNADTDERMVEEIVNGHPLRKLLTPEEVADTVAFLCRCSLHINGINMVMNAGDPR